jgi:hypothetical protein
MEENVSNTGKISSTSKDKLDANSRRDFSLHAGSSRIMAPLLTPLMWQNIVVEVAILLRPLVNITITTSNQAKII